jgi:hypothetical protein
VNPYYKDIYTDIKFCETFKTKKKSARRSEVVMTPFQIDNDSGSRPDFERNLMSPRLKKQIKNSNIHLFQQQAMQKEQQITTRYPKNSNSTLGDSS